MESNSEVAVSSTAPVEVSQAPTTGVIDAKSSPAPVSEPKTLQPSAPAQAQKEGGDGAIPTIPTYTPNTKFKVMDKEHEFDEWIRPHIKDAETEKKAKELYEKAYGLDYVKPKYESSQKELETVKTSYQSLYNDAAEALQYKNMSMDSSGQLTNSAALEAFFKKTSLPNEVVYQWVLEKLNRNNLPPDQRRVYDERDAKDLERFHQSRQIEESDSRYQKIATQAREAEVNYVLARPDINQVVQNYDSEHGTGSFKRFVAVMGKQHFDIHGEDPSGETAVSEVLKYIGKAYRGQTAQPMVPTASGEKPLPVIPNVSGKNISPTKKSPRSIEDIRKFAAEARE